MIESIYKKVPNLSQAYFLMCCKRYFSCYSYLKPVGELRENTINLNRQLKKNKKDDPVYIKRPNSRLKSFYKV